MLLPTGSLLITAVSVVATAAVISGDPVPHNPGYGFVVFFVALEATILALTALVVNTLPSSRQHPEC